MIQISVYMRTPLSAFCGVIDGIQRNVLRYGADTGSANAYVVNINPGISSLTSGMEVLFRATNANTAASTLNVSALGVFPVLNQFGATLTAGEIAAGSLVRVIWSAAATSWFVLNSTGAIPTVPTAASTSNSTQTASTAFVKTAIANLSLGNASTRTVGNSSPTQIPDMSYWTGSSGWRKAPDGFIEQWGVSGATTDSVSVTFPVPFTTGVYFVGEHDNGGGTNLTFVANKLNHIERFSGKEYWQGSQR